MALADKEELIGNATARGLGGDGDRFRQAEDGVGLADAPALDKGTRRRQIGLIAGWAALVDPGQEGCTVGVGQAAGVAELAVRGVRVPGGHAALLYHLLDGSRPTGGVLIGQQGERRGFAGAVALLAMFLEQASDVLCIGHRRPGGWGGMRWPGDGTACGFGHGSLHRPPGEHGVDGFDQVLATDLGSLHTLVVAVVDPPPVADGARAVEHEGEWRAVGGEAVGHAGPFVLEHRERQVEFLSVPGHPSPVVLERRCC